MSDSLQTLNWDDLRIVKAIGESGSLVAAATTLALNHSTVSRRLALIEQTLGTVLFDRRRTGYAPTPPGARSTVSCRVLGPVQAALEPCEDPAS